MKRLLNFLNLTISQFFRSPEVRREVCAIAEACGGGGGGSTTPVNGLSNLEGGIGFGGMLTEEYTELTDKNTNSIFYFEQEENGDQEIEISTDSNLYRTGVEYRSREDYSRIRQRVSRDSDGFAIDLEVDTNEGAIVRDDIFRKGWGDAEDYSEDKTEYSYVTKKMLEEKADVNIVSDSPDIDFSERGFYSFTGTTGIWDLVPAEIATGVRYIVANMGSGNLTINAPINTIWEAGNLMSNTILAPGETMVIYSNGIYWTIYN